MIQYNMIDNETEFAAQYEDIKDRFSKNLPDVVKDVHRVGHVHMIVASIDDHMIDIAYRTNQTSVIIYGEGSEKIKNKLEERLNITLNPMEASN